MTLIYPVCIGLLMSALCCTGGNKDKPGFGIEKDLEMSGIRLKDLEGKTINLETYKGKTVFINFWATWCKPCVDEMPSIEKAQNILANQELIFLLASGESPEEIIQFSNLQHYKLHFVQVENSEELGILTLPTTFIFNPKGKLVFSETGTRIWDEKNNIDMILKIANEND